MRDWRKYMEKNNTDEPKNETKERERERKKKRKNEGKIKKHGNSGAIT